MADSIDALLGLGMVGDDSQANMRALANQLRGKQQLGDLYSMSPTLGDQGRAMSTGARQDAARAGGLSRTMGRDQIADTRYDEEQAYSRGRDKISDEQFDRTLQNRADISNNRAGGTGKGSKIKLPGTDASIWTFPDGRITGPRGEPFSNYVEFAEKYPDFAASLAAENSALAKSAESTATTTAKLSVEEMQDTITNVADLEGIYSESTRNIDKMIEAVGDGANTGQVYQMFPTFIDATSRFESAKELQTLALLGQYKLTPVSDKDYRALQQGAQPNLSADQMKEFLVHKKEGVRRMKKANRVTEQYLRDRMRSGKGMPTPDEREAIQGEIDAILHGGGYDFTHQYGVGGESGAVNPGVARPQSVTESEWGKLTPEQQAQLVE